MMTYVCMLSFALVFQSIPPLLSLIILELGVSYAEAGLLMSLFALPGIFIAIPGGLISDRFGMKNTGLVSLVVMIAGTVIVGTGGTLVEVLIGRVVSGAGGLTLAVVLPQLLSRWFLNRELSVSMGAFNTAMPLGVILSFNFFPIIGNSLGWRMPFLLTTGACICALFLFLFVFKEPVEFHSRRTIGNMFGEVTKQGSSIWFVGFAWMWFNAALISFLTFSSDYFVARGLQIGSASFLSSTVLMGSLFLSPLIGYFVHRFGKEEVLIGVSGVALMLLVSLIPSSSSIIPLVVLIGVFGALVPTSIFSLPSKIVDAESLGLAFGVVTACLNLGVLIGPYLAGLIKDLTGEYTFSLYLIALFALLQTVTIVLFKLSRSKKSFR